MALRETELPQTEPLKNLKQEAAPTFLHPARVLGKVDKKEAGGDLVYYLEGHHPSLGICINGKDGKKETVVSNLTLLLKNTRLRDIS